MTAMPKELRVNLLPGWTDHSDENPDGPLTYVRDASESPGALQISCAWYVSGEVPDPDDDDLINLAKGIADTFDAAELVETKSGTCRIGRYGSAVFRCSGFPHVQAWHLSNGRDLIMVTHICAGADPDPAELHEAQEIVEALDIVGVEHQPPQRTVLGGLREWFGRGRGQ